MHASQLITTLPAPPEGTPRVPGGSVGLEGYALAVLQGPQNKISGLTADTEQKITDRYPPEQLAGRPCIFPARRSDNPDSRPSEPGAGENGGPVGEGGGRERIAQEVKGAGQGGAF